jgi:general secretion pathway protein E
MTNLDISESRKPQDGRLSISAFGRKLDIRVSIVPAHFGEKVVLRVLDPKQASIPLEKVGFSEDELKIFIDACSKNQGMILVTGPTGSGKTSTLYAALNHVNSEKRNIITIEDPIEYIMPGVTQMQVNPAKDFNFASGLKSILRQDPNIILIGEIRDKETADIAFQSSLTGHLVFSTLHTNNSVASITRLFDIGLEPYLPASSLVLVVAQRLVKIICPHCKEIYQPKEDIINKFKAYINKYNIKSFYHGKGCQVCRMSGYFERTGIFEVLVIDSKIREMISAKMPEDNIRKEARLKGFKLLVEAGIEKVSRGITTLDEVARVTNMDMDVKLIKADELPEKTEVKKVLIVDDEEDVHVILESRFVNEKFEVLHARNGKEGVDAAFREKPDLIIMDLMMPVMDGMAATKMLKQNLETALIPIMILTAKNDVESEIKGIEIGADDYMGKPFDGKRLVSRAKMLIRRGK